MVYLKKSLGQHFLISPAICSKIANLLNLTDGDQILEIGPGGGALTQVLKPHKNLLLLEKDKYWANNLVHKIDSHSQVILMDAMSFPWRKLVNLGKWKITGNLPYNIASPLIWNIVSQCDVWEKAVFMVQKEVALRLIAKSGTKAYGALTVWVQSFAQPNLEFVISPGAFRPPPKVDSAVVSFTPKANIPKNPEGLKKIINIFFQSRRKQLGTILNRANLPMLERAFQENGIDLTLRPESLSISQFNVLTNYIESD